jgi:hypothetical protein
MSRVLWLVVGLLAVVLPLPSPGYREESKFLRQAGFEENIERFKEEEVEIQQIARLHDDALKDLGIRTIGARMRIRDAAETWMDSSQARGPGVEGGQGGVEEDGGQQENVQIVVNLEEEAQEEEDGEGKEEEGEEEEEERQLLFYTSRSANGKKIFHHFLNNFYKFNRRKVKKNGRAYFHCSVEGCKASVKANYTSKATMNDEEPVPDLPTLDRPSAHVFGDGTAHPIQVSVNATGVIAQLSSAKPSRAEMAPCSHICLFAQG